MDLSLLQRAQTSGSSYFKSPKIILTTESYGEVLLVFPDSRMRDQTLTKIDLSLRRKAWERQQQPRNKQQTPKGSGSRPSQTGSGSVGVAAIIARNKRRNEEAKALSKSAFGDFEGLLQRARDVQRVIEKYSATLDKDKQKNNSNSNNNSDYDSSTEDEIKLTNMLRGMGMATNAVTKSSAGSTSMYHEQLARQLADFLSRSGALQSSGGIMTLVDVYCLYNRARGTNLISPDDLLSVVELLQTLQLGMSKRKFPSGVVVIQADDHDDELMAKKLRELSLNNGGVTALFASQHFKINLILATELLLAAERLEYLCRDSTLESLMFFPNRFLLDGW